MIQSRLENNMSEHAEDSSPARDHFEPLSVRRQQGNENLTPDADQSWRELEALRFAVYEKVSHLPPQDDQTWREREALRIAQADESEIADQALDSEYEPKKPVAESRSGGKGRIAIALFAIAIITPAIVVVAVPGILREGYWGAPESAANLKAEQLAAPARVAAAPAANPAPPDRPALATGAILSPAPPAEAIPEAEPEPVFGSAMRAARRDDAEHRSLGGIYAMMPAPDGTLKYKYIPSKPRSGVAPARHVKATTHRVDGFYAKVPGPNGTLISQYFPSKPSR